MDIIKITIAIATLMVLGVHHIEAKGNKTQQINDSIRLEEVVVTGTIPSVNLKIVPMSITIVEQQQIKNRIEPSLLPLLTEQVPGLFITQRGVMGYGVSGGSAGTMSIRGVGGAPTAGVLILIDGHPQYMGLMGHPLADSYQSAMTERVEVVRGPASVLYGSNAMGGVINIITKKQKSDGLHQSSRIMYGSYNTLNIDLSSQYRKNKLYANIDLGLNKSDGHRENMDFSQKNMYAKIGYDINKNWTAFTDLNISKTNSSNPGTVALPLNDNDANVTRGVTSIAAENKYNKTSGIIKFFYNFGSHHINDGYIDGDQPLPYRFRSNDDMMGFSINQSYSFFAGNKTTAGFDYQKFGGKAWNKFVDESDNVDLANIHLHTLASFANIQQSFIDNKLTLNGGIRLDYHEKNGSKLIPQFGISYIPTSTSSLKAIVSKGFRNPTIREMYMFPPQNPDLKPESLMNYEISAIQSLIDNKLNIGVNLFLIKGSNFIKTAMIDGKPLNINSGEVENKGFEITSAYQLNTNFRFNANYSYLNMKHKIVAAPKNKLYVGGEFSKGKWHISSGVQYINNLYTNIQNDDAKESFVLLNARIKYSITNNIDLFAKGENLLNQNYEINEGFPMPGATFFGGISLSL